MGFFGRLFRSSDIDARKDAIIKKESVTPSNEAVERKARSIAFLKGAGVPTIEHLPVIEDTHSVKSRSTNEVSRRLIACTICALGGESGDRALIDRVLVDFKAHEFLSPEEHTFINHSITDQQTRTQFSWRYERAWVLLWALGYVEKLNYPPSICDAGKLVTLIKGRSVDVLAQNAKPRSTKEILDEADRIYRLHWAVTEERVNRTVSVPKEVERGVVQERHAALNWLIGYMNQEWDDITTDT